MARKKQFKAIIQDSMFFESLIWMSYRYCIGRKSIAACTHADNIAKYIHYLPKERRQFIAKDIRREISDRLHWQDNIQVNGFEYKYDAVTLLLKYIKENPDTDIKNTKFFIDVNVGQVTIEPAEKPSHFSFMDDVSDYIGWIKLANCLDEDSYVTIEAEYDGENLNIEGFEYPNVFQNEIRFLYTSVKKYLEQPWATSYIAPEYIKEIIK